jgi:signal transduction histidine kinase
MRLKMIDRAHKSLGFRLAAWYSVSLILSSLAVAIISYFFLSSSLRDNRKLIELKLKHYLSLAEQGGIQAIQKAAGSQRNPNRRTSFFVRVVDSSDRTVFLSHPQLWENFDLKPLQDRPIEGEWQYFPAKQKGDVLEVTFGYLPNGYLLEVGKNVEDRQEILEHFRETIAAVMIPMIVIALAGGAFLAFRALRPIRNLIHTTQIVVETGRMDSRVPTSRTSDELNDLVKLFNKMLDRIESLIKGMREALDNVAHDLRTPMMRLRGVAEMALQGESSPQQYHESLANCVEESDRILTLLNSLMDISEADTGTMRLHLETVAVSKLIQEITELYQYVAEDKGISITVNCAKDLHITADQNRIRQVLANLLDNAIKYTSPGGTVAIDVQGEKEHVLVRVKDTGAGIPFNEIPKIWDRLHRGDKSRSQPGLGLGLSLVKAVVEAHRGRVEVQSEPGVGSVFTLYLSMTSA